MRNRKRATPKERKANSEAFQQVVRGYKLVERAYANSRRMAKEGRGLF